MKVLHINTYDRGGAANACLRLHEGLLNSGIDSKVLILKKTNNNFPEVYAYETEVISFSGRLQRKIKRILKELKLYRNGPKEKERKKLLKLRSKGLEMISFPESDIDITNNKYFHGADIIHLHWVVDFLDYKAFFKKCKKPIVWTFHDQNPFLGVEHYAEKYLGPEKNGFPMVRQFSEVELAIEKKYKQIKHNILQNTPLNIVALCNWMQTEILGCNMFHFAKIFNVPNGVDSKQFRILNKTLCRELLELPLEKKILLFVSDNINHNRKGLNYLLKAIENINASDVVVCGIGWDKTKTHNGKFIELGSIHDQRLMTAAYSAADLFVIPSLMDNLPNTVIESLLCGTAVISFPIGGLPDMIKHKKNGYIADEISVDALAKTINIFFEKGVEFTTDQIRYDAIERYDISVQVESMVDLYNDIYTTALT